MTSRRPAPGRHDVRWPTAWPRRKHPLLIVGFGFLLAVAVALPIAGVNALGDGDPRSVVFIAGTPLFLGVGLLGLSKYGGVRHRAQAVRSAAGRSGTAGLVFRYSSVQAWSQLCVIVGALALFVGFAVVDLAQLEPDPGGSSDIPSFLITVPFAVYFLLTLVSVIRGGLARGRLVLSPDGVYHRSWMFEVYAPWSAIWWVRPVDGGRGGPWVRLLTHPDAELRSRRTSRMWNQIEYKELPSVVVPAQQLPLDPAVLYHGLHFYAANPAMRAELGDRRGVERFREGNFPPAPVS